MKTTTPITFGTFCSGIGAPEKAWSALGWRAVFASEIEPFPCAVLSHHYPETPNLGDMTKVDGATLEPVDIICAGTPCQSFSVAGLRKGMADPRGNLALDLLRIVDRARPRWLVWENVPGVLSSWSDEATFTPSEESERLIREAGRAARAAELDLGTAISDCGFEEADQTNDFDQFTCAIWQLGYSVAWGSLDAQYFGLAQRRERVFVVASLGEGNDSAAVLFDRECLSGNPAPSRETQSRIAASLTRGADSGGAGGYAGRRREDDFNIVTNALDAHMGMGGPDDNAAQANHLIAAPHADISPAIKARDYKGASSDSDGAILVPMVAGTLNGNGKAAGSATQQDAECGMLVTHSLRADGFDASEDGTGRGTPLVPCIPILEVGKGSSSRGDGPNGCGIGAVGDPMFTLQAGAQHAIAFDTTQVTSAGNYSNPKPGDPCHPLAEGGHPPAVAFQCHGSNVGPMGTMRGGNGNETGGVPFVFQTRCARNGRGMPDDVAPALTSCEGGTHADTAPHVGGGGMAVRRLTPRECERLQGFSDDFTAVQYRGKVAADGPRYRALGNSMAVPVLRWIGERIAKVLASAAES